MGAVILSILVLGFLIFFHELGHYLAARTAGVRVHELSLGFGPRIAGWHRNGIAYSIRLLPLGGYVRMAGETPEDADDPNSFTKKPLRSRLGVIAAGPVANLVLAVVLFFLVYGVVGVQVLADDTPTVGRVLAGTPAAAAGVQAGDRIQAVDGQPISTWMDLVTVISSHPGKTMSLTVQRGSQILHLEATPEDRNGEGFLGISARTRSLREPPWTAAWHSLVLTGQMAVALLLGLVAIFHTGLGGVTGPVGITEMIGEASRMGLANLLFLAGALSAQLALFNLIPVPALDGSRLAFLVWEGIRGRPVDREKENMVHFIGFALLMLLMIVVTYRDVFRLIPG